MLCDDLHRRVNKVSHFYLRPHFSYDRFLTLVFMLSQPCSTPIGGVLVGEGGYGWTEVAAFSASVALGGTLVIIGSRQVATGGKIFVKF